MNRTATPDPATARPARRRRRVIGAAAALVLGTTASLAVAVQPANASVWHCGPAADDWCTSAVSNAPLRNYINGPVLYTIPRGAIVDVACFFESDDGIWYYAARPGFVWGVVHGNYLATGHDPNPNIGAC